MFTTKIKADYRVPGLNYKRMPGMLTGKLYTTLPHRFKTAVISAVKAGVWVFFGSWGLLAFGQDTTALIDALLLGIATTMIGYPVFVVYAPGKRIKITKDELRVGLFRYDLKHVSSFYQITYYNDKNLVSGHSIGFRNGEREEDIFVLNSAETNECIIPFLNRMREAIQSEQASPIQRNRTAPEQNEPARAMEF